jgi:hypothetical protein
MEHVLVFFCYCLVLVVWNMPRVSKDVIEKFFDKFWPSPKNSAFVQFLEAEDAKEALNDLKGLRVRH